MPQSLAKVLIHVVFSTKERRRFLRDTNEFRQLLKRYEITYDERSIWD